MFIMIIFFSQVSLPEKEPAKALGILLAISTFDIGQNDLSAGFKSMSYEQLRAFIPNIVNQFTAGIQVSFTLLCIAMAGQRELAFGLD